MSGSHQSRHSHSHQLTGPSPLIEIDHTLINNLQEAISRYENRRSSLVPGFARKLRQYVLAYWAPVPPHLVKLGEIFHGIMQYPWPHMKRLGSSLQLTKEQWTETKRLFISHEAELQGLMMLLDRTGSHLRVICDNVSKLRGPATSVQKVLFKQMSENLLQIARLKNIRDQVGGSYPTTWDHFYRFRPYDEQLTRLRREWFAPLKVIITEMHSNNDFNSDLNTWPDNDIFKFINLVVRLQYTAEKVEKSRSCIHEETELGQSFKNKLVEDGKQLSVDIESLLKLLLQGRSIKEQSVKESFRSLEDLHRILFSDEAKEEIGNAKNDVETHVERFQRASIDPQGYNTAAYQSIVGSIAKAADPLRRRLGKAQRAYASVLSGFQLKKLKLRTDLPEDHPERHIHISLPDKDGLWPTVLEECKCEIEGHTQWLKKIYQRVIGLR